MAQRITKNKIIEIIILVFILVIFVALVNKYIINGLESKFNIFKKIDSMKNEAISISREKKVECEIGEIKIALIDGEICRKKIYDETKKDNWLKIYDTYPKFSHGRATIYDFLNQGGMKTANQYMKNIVEIDRFEPITLDKFTWEEDPYNDRYWTFMYYSLREMRHLIYAYNKTGNDKYSKKLIEIVESFLDSGTKKEHAWDDKHSVAFRTMSLTNIWWFLRENNMLSVELNEKMLKSIEMHGEFLLDENNYEGKHNHGISEAAALLLVGINFPDFQNSQNYISVAKNRLDKGIENIVDADGVLVENSPFYHFYALEKYWDIKKYLLKYKLGVSDNYNKKLQDMISYATYMLQPDLRVPLMGASLDRYIGNSGTFAEIAKENPEFLYVLTNGKQGIAPSKTNIYYPVAGRVIMRSDWKKKDKFENEFKNQTQLIFDVGNYRTTHSDLDALTFNLYSNGKALLIDTGLYTYDESNKLKEYFHGTRGHNTVVVDGLNQRKGTTNHNIFIEGENYVTHSSQHDLYPQVHHQRNITLLGKDVVIVVDRLLSRREHDYDQIFHLFVGANAKIESKEKIVIKNKEGETELVMHQMINNDIDVEKVKDSDKCSLQYGKTVSCETVHFKKHGKIASFVTVLEIGNEDKKIVSKMVNDNLLTIEYDGKKYDVNLNKIDDKFIKESIIQEVEVDNKEFALNKVDGSWKIDGNNDKYKLFNSNGKVAIGLKKEQQNKEFSKKTYFEADIDGVDKYYSKNQNIYTDIPFNSEEYFRIYEQEDFLPIFGYHHIVEDNETIKFPNLEIHVSDFDKQISYLTKDLGCRWFTFGEIMENYVTKEKKIPKHACVLNFDDGRKDHFTLGYKTFKKYGAVATFYSIIGDTLIKERDSSLSVSDINELINNGNEIGSHTVSAYGLLSDKYSKKDLIYQLNESKKMIERLGYDVKTFAYPRGEQNKEIVDLTSEFYLAGRDTEKDNTWRERRPSTISFDDDYLWHMNYYKPEGKSLEEIKKSLWYNNWWQFEEGFKFDFNFDGKSKILSSYKPTENSYAVVVLSNIGDKISNKFIVNKNAEYEIEFLASFRNDAPEISSDVMKVFINDKATQFVKVDDKCYPSKKRTFCLYRTVATELNEGVNIISIKALFKGVLLDKFRVYRFKKVDKSYNLNIKEFKKVNPRKYPNPILVTLTSQKPNSSTITVFVIIGGFLGIVYVLIKYFRKKNK